MKQKLAHGGRELSIRRRRYVDTPVRSVDKFIIVVVNPLLNRREFACLLDHLLSDSTSNNGVSK